MFFPIVRDYVLSPCELLFNDVLHFRVNNLRRCLAERFGERHVGLLGIEIAYVCQFIAHAIVYDHRVCHFACAFQIIKGAGRNFSQYDRFGSPASKQCAHLVQHLFLGGKLPFFRKIPCRTKSLAPRHNSNFHQRIGVLQQPTYRSMPCFMNRY